MYVDESDNKYLSSVAEEATESKRGHFAKLKWFSIAKIIFVWRGLKFKRGHSPLFLSPTYAYHVMCHCINVHTDKWLHNYTHAFVVIVGAKHEWNGIICIGLLSKSFIAYILQRDCDYIIYNSTSNNIHFHGPRLQSQSKWIKLAPDFWLKMAACPS